MAEEDEAKSTAHRHAAMIQPRRPPVAVRPASRYSGVVTTTTEPIDWNRVAVGVANTAREHRREQPIGAFHPWGDLTTAALFGNGETRYDDEDSTAQITVESLRQRFDGLGVIEIGFGLDSKASSTWTIIVKAPGQMIDEQRLERLGQELKEAYRIACEQE